jgi:hypothetical protein
MNELPKAALSPDDGLMDEMMDERDRWLTSEYTQVVARAFEDERAAAFEALKRVSEHSSDPKVTAAYAAWAKLREISQLLKKGKSHGRSE